MQNKTAMNLMFASSISDICELNSSFDKATISVCYHGKNRNGSSISKDVLENSAKRTLANVPIVCNYNRDEDSIGGHDIEIVKDKNGVLKIVNVTQPIGCVPESAKYWFENVEESNGETHEYLFTEVLLWKRQEAYQKVKEDSTASHSMEITVNDGSVVDGTFVINDFEFTALCLLGDGIEPCFESSALEFSKAEFKDELSLMMQELKESYKEIATSFEADNTNPLKNITEGGETILEYENATVTENAEENVQEEVNADNNENFELEAETEVSEETSVEEQHEEYALGNNLRTELMRAVTEEKYERYGDMYPRYSFEDFDAELGMVYAWDRMDWLLYGMNYTMNGDAATVDFTTKKRCKYVITEFDNGDQLSPFVDVFNAMEEEVSKGKEFETKYNELSAEFNKVQDELNELREYKLNVESEKVGKEREELFARFDDLVGLEGFDALKENKELDLGTLEEKCYALRGKNMTQVKFSLDDKAPKQKVVKESVNDTALPYGGIVERYLENE